MGGRCLRQGLRTPVVASSCYPPSLLTTLAPLLPRRFLFLITLSPDLLLPAREFVSRSDIADGAVETLLVVVGGESSHQGLCLGESLRACGTNGRCLDRLVESFDLPVGLRVVRGRSNMGHPHEPDVGFEVACNKLRPVVRDDSRRDAGDLFASPFKDDLNIGLGHRFAHLPVDEGAAVAIEDTAQIVEGRRDVEVGDVDVPA